MASKSLLNRILTKEEVQFILTDLHMLARRGWKHRQRLAFFRVCACAGLRASEMAGLKIKDVHPFGPHPEIDVPASIAKGNKRRSVPLSWDLGTKEDIQRWHQHRLDAGPEQPFFHNMMHQRPCSAVTRQTMYNWWKHIITILGPDRSSQIGGPHSGRHTFCTHALAGGRSLGEVRDAAGHSNINVTDIYIHAMPRKGLADLWQMKNKIDKLPEDLDDDMEMYYNYRSTQPRGRTLGHPTTNSTGLGRW